MAQRVAGGKPGDGRAGFFVQPAARRRLEDEALPKVILVGSFTGGWNFGDLMQLQGALRWHRLHQPGHALCVIHGLGSVPDRAYFDRLGRVFGACDWLFFAPGHGAYAERAAALGVERLSNGIAGPVTLHVYGGGFFNRLWGRDALRRIEAILDRTTPRHYIISGQQVGAEFAALLAAHCRRYQPDVIGCRDQESMAILRRRAVDALLSGDDAFEELDAAASVSPSEVASSDDVGQTSAHGGGGGARFALYLNSSSYVTAGSKAQRAALREIDQCIELLAQHAGRDAIPLLIRAYAGDRPHIYDTLRTIENTRFARLFRASASLDLVDLFTRDQLAEAALRLRQCRFVVSTSYHVTLFAKILGIPVYLFAFNDYYRQKRQGLGDAALSLSEFLAADQRQIIERQTSYIAHQRELRARWLAALSTTLAAPPHDARIEARAASAEARLRASSGLGWLRAIAARLRRVRGARSEP